MSILEHMFKDLPMSNNFDEKLFGGLYQDTFVCKNDHIKQHPIKKIDEILMIPIAGQNIQECMDNYLKPEEINANCDDCENKILVKQTEIISEPSTLIIQLKRFSHEREKRISTKRQDRMRMTKSIKMATGGTYTVSSIVNHFGDSPQEGHYNILIYDAMRDKFILVDDQYINQNVNITSDFESSSYIFVYTRDI